VDVDFAPQSNTGWLATEAKTQWVCCGHAAQALRLYGLVRGYKDVRRSSTVENGTVL